MATAPEIAVASVPEALASIINGRWIVGEMETDLPPHLLRAYIFARMGETHPDPGAGNKRIIDSNEPWEAEVYWVITGHLRRLLCGKWNARLFLESLGKDDLDPHGSRKFGQGPKILIQ